MKITSGKNILLCVSGATPQIVTETLYVLAIEKKIRIDEIQIITTQDGEDKILTGKINGRGEPTESLLNKKEGQFYKFIKDYKNEVGKIKFNKSCIVVIKDKKGKLLNDIRSVEENELAGDQIAEHVKLLCSDPGTTVYASVAGGRKTLGIYLTTAMQLFARANDHLSHVLVNEEFETNTQFFYPPPKPVTLTLRTGKTISTKNAKISLAEVPFIRLRGAGITAEGTYKEMVTRAQTFLDADEKILPLEIDLKTNRLTIGVLSARLTDYETLLYCLFAQKRIAATCDDEAFLTFRQIRKQDLDAAFSQVMMAKEGEPLELNEDNLWQTDWEFLINLGDQAESNLEIDYKEFMNSLSRAIGRASKRLRKAGIPKKYEITAKGKTRPKRYGLDLPADMLKLNTQ